jgi:hypothetical protein
MRVCGGTLFSDGIPGSSVSSDPHSDPHWDTRRWTTEDGNGSNDTQLRSARTRTDVGGPP